MPPGNQRRKLYITTAATYVLPSPVGSATSVLCSSATFAIARWYGRADSSSPRPRLRYCGSTHSSAVDSSSGIGGAAGGGGGGGGCGGSGGGAYVAAAADAAGAGAAAGAAVGATAGAGGHTAAGGGRVGLAGIR